MHHAFFYGSLPSLHDNGLKMPNFTFYGRRRQATKNFFSLLTITLSFLAIQFWESPSHLGHVHTIADGYGVNVVVNFLSQVFFFHCFWIWVAFVPPRKSDRMELLFTHKHGCGDAISVTERSCAAPISKVESQISDRCSCCS